ncbi:hypothetical protein V8G54_001516 [Vigna mungo]|uniref:Uncharacterized protein n=1 Tax=Vigna mungo TaxID=3915 RepID=A0AAQ3P9H5_VIGMU
MSLLRTAVSTGAATPSFGQSRVIVGGVAYVGSVTAACGGPTFGFASSLPSETEPNKGCTETVCSCGWVSEDDGSVTVVARKCFVIKEMNRGASFHSDAHGDVVILEFFHYKFRDLTVVLTKLAMAFSSGGGFHVGDPLWEGVRRKFFCFGLRNA